MKRLFTLLLIAFVFTFTAPITAHNAVAADEGAATAATDDAMHDHGSPANESNKTNKDKGRKHAGKGGAGHKAKHHGKHHKKSKSDDAGADAGK